jgi:hypothetical protein
MAVLKLNVELTQSVDWSGMRETPAGVRDRGDPRRLPGTPANRTRMEWKSTDKFNTAIKIKNSPFGELELSLLFIQ